MFNRPNRNDINDDTQDIRNDVSQLADTLEAVLKSWGSDAKDEADAAKRKAQSLLRETRARMNGRSRTTQAACDMASCATTFVREKPLCTLGTVAAVGIFVGALLSLRKYARVLSPGRFRRRGFSLPDSLKNPHSPPCPARLIIGALLICISHILCG